MPLFLTQMRGFSPTEMGWLMGTLGISSTIGSFVVPGISDRIGRKPVMIAVPLLGVILPLGAIYYTGSAWGLAGIFFVGWALNGVFPMFMGTIPSETVNPRHVATALGIVMGCGEVLGGAFSPTIAGWAADVAGLAAPLWIMAGSCIAAGCLGFGLEETAPRKLKRSGSSVPVESFS
jgi:MFS family permease